MSDSLAPDRIVRVNCAGHPWHGKAVTIVSVEPRFNLAPPDAAPLWSEVVFVRWRGKTIGFGRRHLKPGADR